MRIEIDQTIWWNLLCELCFRARLITTHDLLLQLGRTGIQKNSEGVQVQGSQGMTGLDMKDTQSLERHGKKQGIELIELKLLQVSVPVSLAWCPKIQIHRLVSRLLVILSRSNFFRSLKNDVSWEFLAVAVFSWHEKGFWKRQET
jgi:hypothetical protein